MAQLERNKKYSQRVLKCGNAENPSNHIKLKDPSVSYDHLEVHYIDDNTLLVKDLNSSNGTRVNNRPVKNKEITLNDKIEIGRNTMYGWELMNEFKKQINKNRVRFYEEFENIGNLYREYYDRVKQIKTNYKNKVLALKIAVPIILLIFFIGFGKQLGIPPSGRIIAIIGGSGLATLFGDKLFDQDEMKLKLQYLKEEYQQKVTCPKCGYKLFGRTYKYWKKQRKCPKCHANWVK